MKKTVCVALALLLALLCGCGGSGKSAPSLAPEVTSEERQLHGAVRRGPDRHLHHEPGGGPGGAVPGRGAHGGVQLSWGWPARATMTAR